MNEMICDFGISLMPYKNEEIDDCFTENRIENDDNYSDKIHNNHVLYHYYSFIDDLISNQVLNKHDNLYKYDRYNTEIYILSIFMSVNPNIMQYCLNIIKKKNLKKYNQVMTDLKLSQINLNLKKVRKKRTPVPEHKKDASYWKKRNANTESARRSRQNNMKKSTP